MVIVTKEQSQYGDGATLVAEMEEAQDEIEALARRLQASMTELHSLQDEFERAVKGQNKALKNLGNALQGPSGVGENSSAPDVAARSSSSDAPEDEAVLSQKASLVRLRQRLAQKELQHLMPASGGFFVEALLGGLNVRFIRKSERMSFKTEYEKLKLKLAPGLVVLCIVCLIFQENRWVHMLLQLCLSGYYVTLAVRENILRVNGSNIRSWWIIHHYFTMMQCVLLTTWPDNASYAAFRKGLHLFGLYNSVLQIFQTRYQMARLYALRSLGMAGEMDVASSDSTQIHWSEGMAVLLPLILLGQGMQAMQAVNLMRIYPEYPHELQILMLALLFLANFVGNFYTTMVVLNEKRKQRRTGGVSPALSNRGAAASSSESPLEAKKRT